MDHLTNKLRLWDFRIPRGRQLIVINLESLKESCFEFLASERWHADDAVLHKCSEESCLHPMFIVNVMKHPTKIFLARQRGMRYPSFYEFEKRREFPAAQIGSLETLACPHSPDRHLLVFSFVSITWISQFKVSLNDICYITQNHCCSLLTLSFIVDANA